MAFDGQAEDYESTAPAAVKNPKFDGNAAADVLLATGNAKLNLSPLTQIYESAAYGNSKNVTFLQNVSIDKSLKSDDISVDQKIEALRAGLNDFPDGQKFLDTIAKHDNLKESFGRMLLNEGDDILKGMKELTSGDGAKLDADQFAAMMESDVKRGIVAQTFDATATKKFTMEDMVKMSKATLAAAEDPTNEKTRNEFFTQAQTMGIKTEGLEQEAASDMFKDFIKNPDGAISKLISGMGLPPEWAEMLTGLLSMFTKGTMALGKDVVTHYGDGFKKIGESAGVEGRKILDENGFGLAGDETNTTRAQLGFEPKSTFGNAASGVLANSEPTVKSVTPVPTGPVRENPDFSTAPQ